LKGFIAKLRSVASKYSFIFKTVFESSKWIFVAAIFLVLVPALIPIATSKILRDVVSLIESVIASAAKTSYVKLLFPVFAYVLVAALRNLVMSCWVIICRLTGLSLTYNIQSKIAAKIKSTPYYMFYDQSFQNLYANVIRKSDHEPLEIVYSTISLCSELLQIAILSTVVACLRPWILPLLIICFLPSVICQLKIQKENVNVWKSQTQNYRHASYCFDQVTSQKTSKEIRLFNLFNYFERGRKKAFLDNIKAWRQFGKKELLTTTVSQFFSKAGIFVVIAWLFIKTIQKEYSVPDFIFYFSIIFSFQDTYAELVDNFARHYTSMLFMNQFFDFLDIKHTIASGHELPERTTNHVLEFKNVSFKYPNTDFFALRDINFKLKTGDVVCFVGENGSGKTTLVNLMLRVYEPTQGEILLDGKNIKDYDFEEYQKVFSAIHQDYQKYAVLIKESISFGNLEKNGSLADFERAGKLATADKFIKSFGKKYDSDLTKMFSEDGEELSGGQWQKLALARVFYSDSHILIFDEPTSAVDPISELEIHENIEKRKDKLVIFISHRMYTSKNASQVIVLANGTVVAMGTHKELMNSHTEYQVLFNSQAKRYTDSSPQ
jgi:ATP-binding cassette subfamily B protein